MNRRKFFSLFGLGVSGIALEQAIPMGRAWSFPKEIVIGDFIELPPGSSVRVVEVFDPLRGHIRRLDIAGPPFALVGCLATEARFIRGVTKLRPEMVPEIRRDAFNALRERIDGRLRPNDIYGVTVRI
jgi:hypothetical protein